MALAHLALYPTHLFNEEEGTLVLLSEEKNDNSKEIRC